MAQAVYMPQASAYLPDENTSPAPDDPTQRPESSKPETWPLFLPSAIPQDNRSPCYKGVIETERVLRLAQLQDNLVDLRRSRRALRNLQLYFKRNVAGEGQKTQTRTRAVETSAKSRINRAIRRYRTAYHALLGLDPSGEWTKEFRELRNEDNRGPLKEAEEMGIGDGQYTPSWIWTTPSAAALPGEGSEAEQREVNETARHEWMTCRARADRWVEEKELVQEEMRRVIVFLEWKSRSWSEKVGSRMDSCTPDIQRGADAYARKQAHIHREIAIVFAGQWLPYLRTCDLDTGWATKFPWASQILSCEKEPTKSSLTPFRAAPPKPLPTASTPLEPPPATFTPLEPPPATSTPLKPPSATSSPLEPPPMVPSTPREPPPTISSPGFPVSAGGLGMSQKSIDTRTMRSGDNSYREDEGGRRSSEDADSSDEECEEGGEGDGYYSEDFDDGKSEAEFGFEYDDDYMS